MKIDNYILNEEKQVRLTAIVQPVGGDFGNVKRRPAVLILPGGGYNFCCDREAEPVAFAYLNAGFQAFILRYSTGEDICWPQPLKDYDDAMEFVISHSEEWHVEANRITVIGFSAGGHLAACAATMSKNRPSAAILCYPVIDKLCVNDYLPSAPDAAEAVDEKTCPCFIVATRTDDLVPVENSLHFMNALCKHDISFETHIFANGPHGLSTGEAALNTQKSSEYYHEWVKHSISWLFDLLGGIDMTGLLEPKFDIKMNGNWKDSFNVDCTIDYLLNNQKAREVVLSVLPTQDGDILLPVGARKVSTMRYCLGFIDPEGKMLTEVEAKLNQIPNHHER